MEREEYDDDESISYDSEGEFDLYELADDLDSQILLHKDAHFDGCFDRMIAYYLAEGKGVQAEFSLRRIQQLQLIEESQLDPEHPTRSLADYLLTGNEAEIIVSSLEIREQLKELAESDREPPRPETLIARLILSEEGETERVIEAIASHGQTIVPLLIELLTSERFQHPLFPGYGLAPDAAAHCLGRIGSEAAIQYLFEALGERDFEGEEALLRALRSIGQPAVEFLIARLSPKSTVRDAERAAVALGTFDLEAHPEVAHCALEILESQRELPHALASQILYLCEALRGKDLRKRFSEVFQASVHRFEMADREMAMNWLRDWKICEEN